jgi:hypothetical protein
MARECERRRSATDRCQRIAAAHSGVLSNDGGHKRLLIEASSRHHFRHLDRGSSCREIPRRRAEGPRRAAARIATRRSLRREKAVPFWRFCRCRGMAYGRLRDGSPPLGAGTQARAHDPLRAFSIRIWRALSRHWCGGAASPVVCASPDSLLNVLATVNVRVGRRRGSWTSAKRCHH